MADGDKININTASKEEITRTLGIDEDAAQDIITYREERGGFKSVDELNDIPGISDMLTEDTRNQIAVE